LVGEPREQKQVQIRKICERKCREEAQKEAGKVKIDTS
jgi:hypothetical protein